MLDSLDFNKIFSKKCTYFNPLQIIQKNCNGRVKQ